MARKIIWTETADLERFEILDYWVKRNKSKAYSIKLNKLITYNVKAIRQNPLIGRKSELPNVRVKAIREYLLFYEITPTIIYILSLWDGRRNPLSSILK